MSELEWQRIEPTETQKVGYRTIVTKTFRQPDGNERSFQTVSAEGTKFVGCIALTADNKVIIARQYRPGPERVMEEIPGGLVEKDEDPKTAMLRELAEETGYTGANVKDLGFVYKDAYHNATWHYFLVTGCTQNELGQRVDDSEVIDTELISVSQLIDNARHGRMTDTEAVFLAYEDLVAVQHEQ